LTSASNAILDMSAGALSGLVRSGQVSAVEVTEIFLSRIEERVAGHAFITTCPEYAAAHGRATTGRPACGGAPGRQGYVPYGWHPDNLRIFDLP